MTDNPSEPDSNTNSIGWKRVIVAGMVPPGLPRVLRGGAEGTVQKDGSIDVDDIEDTSLKLDDTEAISPGTRVSITRRKGYEYCRPLAERNREQREQERRQDKKVRARARAKDWRRNRAAEFWDCYEIPFEYDVAIKGRRSGLQRGSWGDGKASNTVYHLFVQEPFSEGRLQRANNTYLCDDEANHRFEKERQHDSEDSPFLPKVTCVECLRKMQRWLIDESPATERTSAAEPNTLDPDTKSVVRGPRPEMYPHTSMSCSGQFHFDDVDGWYRCIDCGEVREFHNW